jgi:hypothetical protein
LGTEIPNGQYRVKIASKPAYITLAGGLVSGSTVPVVSDIARIGDITAWSDARTNPTAQIVYEVNLEDGRRTTFKTQSLSVQFEGETGPGIVFRGEWTGSIEYLYNIAVRRRDAVLRNIDDTVHYWATTEQLVTASSAPFTSEPQLPAGPPYESGVIDDANGWEYLGEQDLFVAAKIAIFEESFVKNTINVGNNPDSAFANIVIAGGRVDPYFAIGQNGTVGLSGDQTGSGIIGYDRPGIFLGVVSSSISPKTSRFSLQNGSSGAGERSFLWDGNNLEINAGNLTLTPAGDLSVTGTINANAGNFTNVVNIGSGSITGSLLVGTDTTKITITGTNDPSSSKIFAGIGNWNNTNTGFYMDASGRFSLKNALNWDGNTLNISGNINITGGDTFTELQNISSSLQEVSASAGESIVDDEGKINFIPAPQTGEGLYLTPSNLGYYSGSIWKTYMSSSGDFFLAGTGAGGLTWNSSGSQLTIVGNGVFQGDIEAAAGFIGGWEIRDNTLYASASSGQVTIDPGLPGMSITNNAGEVKLRVRTGFLSSTLGGVVTSTVSPSISHGFLERTSANNGTTTVTFTPSNFSNTLVAGQYNVLINASNLAKSNLLTSDFSFNGFVSITYGFEIINTGGEVVSIIQVAGASINSASSTSNGVEFGGNFSINIPTAGSYQIRPFYRISNFMSSGEVLITLNSLASTTYTFNPVTNFAELTDGGLQIVSSVDSFVKLERGAFYPLEVRGQSLFERAGTGTTGDAMRVRGNIRPIINQLGDIADLGDSGNRWNTIFSVNALNTSDKSLKKNIKKSDLGLSFINKLNPVKYHFKEENDTSPYHYGLISQEVNDVINSNNAYFVRKYIDNSTENWLLAYNELLSPMILAIQELSQKVTDLELIISGSNNL